MGIKTATATHASNAMWLPIIICFSATAVIGGKSSENGIKTLGNDVRWKKADFEDRIQREFEGTTNRILISPREEKVVDDIAAIGNKYSITLRDLKLAREPNLKISSVNSTLEYFSMGIRVAADDDLVFSGKIYANEDTVPSGDARYAMTNVKGSGLVGLGLGRDGKFLPTNYFMNYSDDRAGFRSTWEGGSFDEPELRRLQFSEEQLKRGFRKVINNWLKNRLDTALARISITDVLELGQPNVLQIHNQFSALYDNVVDSILNNVNKQMKEHDMIKLKLPDFGLPFKYDFMGLSVNGKVQGSEGWVRNLSTFIRRGSSSLSLESGHFILFSSLGMTELSMGYNVCAIKIAGVGPSGSISGTIGKNSANLSLSIDVKNRKINLVTFELTDFSDFDIKVTGLGPFNWLASKITGMLIEKTKGNFIPIIEEVVKQQIGVALGKLDVEEIFKKIGV